MNRSASIAMSWSLVALPACIDDTVYPQNWPHAENHDERDSADTETAGSESGSGSGGELDECTPRADDGDCYQCLRERCCEVIEACVAVESCEPFWYCLIEVNDVVACVSEYPAAFSGTEAAAIGTCADTECPDVCSY